MLNAAPIGRNERSNCCRHNDAVDISSFSRYIIPLVGYAQAAAFASMLRAMCGRYTHCNSVKIRGRTTINPPVGKTVVFFVWPGGFFISE
jgi:hypothetical protein